MQVIYNKNLKKYPITSVIMLQDSLTMVSLRICLKRSISMMQREIGDEAFMEYLQAIPAGSTHAGYFSIDKKGRMTNSKIKNKKERTTDDVDTYDLIMKNKELLLDRDPKRSPVRFIF